MTRFHVAALCALLVSSPALAQRYLGQDEETFTWSRRISSGGSVTIKNFNGAINITSSSGSEVQIRAEKRVRGERGGASVSDIAFDVDESSEGVMFCTVWRGDSMCDEDHNMRDVRGSVILTVAIPRDARLKASTGNGELTVESAGAEVEVATGNGRVRVGPTQGRVRASTGNGDVEIENAKGPVKVSTGNGRVFVATSAGPVTATTGNGDIDVRMQSLRTDDDMTFSSGSGTIRLTLPAEFNGEIDAGTGNGTLSSDFAIQLRGRMDPQHVRGTIGSGGRVIRMRTGNGRLELLKS